MHVSSRLLARHVRESNAIERIHLRSGKYVRQHLAAARLVANHPRWLDPLDPRRIHELLLKGIGDDSEVGAYRTVPIWVGSTRCPEAPHVEALMDRWMSLAAACSGLPLKKSEQMAVLLHDWFLCVHPFTDGNGRTARLLLNMLRIRNGLGWKVIEARDAPRYHARIRAFEERFFKKQYADTYLDPER